MIFHFLTSLNKIYIIFFEKVFPDGNILLYVVAKFGHSESFAQIAHYYPFLINKKNNQGDTPFHCATPAGKLKQPPRSSTLLNIFLVHCKHQ